MKTSGVGSNDQYQREDVLKENLRLSSENVELRFQLEQANRDLPRLKVTSLYLLSTLTWHRLGGLLKISCFFVFCTYY